MKKLFYFSLVFVFSILIIGTAYAGNGKGPKKDKCDDFDIQMTEDADNYYMTWQDQSHQAKKLQIDFFVNEDKVIHDTVASDVTEYSIVKQQEYIGSELRFIVHTVSGSLVRGSCSGEISWEGEEYIDTLTWREINTPTPVPLTGRTVSGYDDERNEVVLLTSTCETWIYDGVDWVQRNPEHQPNYCSGATGAFDTDRNIFVVFGGKIPISPGIPIDETWEWDGQDWTQSITSTVPTPVMHGTLAYDPVRHETVLFGGLTPAHGSNSNNETWIYNGTDWQLRNPAHRPAPRHFTTMTFDSVREEVVLFGGWRHSSTTYGDTWTWDGTDWTQKSPVVNARPLAGARMAFDESKELAILIGGAYCCSQSGPFNETWSWDGTTWERIYPEISPDPRSYMGMVYYPMLKRIIGFGGAHEFINTIIFHDTWELLIP